MIAPTVNVSPTQVSATYEGVVTKLSITSDQEWTAFSGDACKECVSCKTSGSIGTQGTVEVTVKANTSNQSREGEIIVKSGITRISIPVSQDAKPEEPMKQGMVPMVGVIMKFRTILLVLKMESYARM